ncbi:hypothetical protein VTI74DRAFT_1729 [Chaetomium olivicolor]
MPLLRWLPEGIELHFGTNHIGPFLFTKLLLPLQRNAAQRNTSGATRIVSVSSAGHRLSPIRFCDYNFAPKEVPPEENRFKSLPRAFAQCTPDGYNGIVTYAQSKTAYMLFTLYLQRRLPELCIAPYALHPGSIETDLGREQDEELAAQFQKIAPYWKSSDEGGSATLLAALDPALSGKCSLRNNVLVSCWANTF